MYQTPEIPHLTAYHWWNLVILSDLGRGARQLVSSLCNPSETFPVEHGMDKKLKAIFREDARRIVSRDRSARKYGQSIDLAGEITTAMVTAYNLGLEDGQAPQDASTPSDMMEAALDWELVPPTSRNVLRSLTHSYSAMLDKPSFIPDELQGYLDPQTDRLRWRVIAEDGEATNNGQTFADKGVSPLLRLGLLAPKAAGTEHLVLTPKGDAACRLYWPRDDRNDPTLPVRGTRA